MSRRVAPGNPFFSFGHSLGLPNEMPVHRQVQASIEVNGSPLEEYGGKQDPENERVFTCWVASEVGKVS